MIHFSTNMSNLLSFLKYCALSLFEYHKEYISLEVLHDSSNQCCCDLE